MLVASPSSLGLVESSSELCGFLLETVKSWDSAAAPTRDAKIPVRHKSCLKCNFVNGAIPRGSDAAIGVTGAGVEVGAALVGALGAAAAAKRRPALASAINLWYYVECSSRTKLCGAGGAGKGGHRATARSQSKTAFPLYLLTSRTTKRYQRAAAAWLAASISAVRCSWAKFH